jgi:hypothetical protein
MTLLPKFIVAVDWLYWVIGLSFGFDDDTLAIHAGIGPLIITVYWRFTPDANNGRSNCGSTGMGNVYK